MDIEQRLDYVCDYLTPAMKEIAKSELNETEEAKAKGLKELKELIKKEKNLVTMTDDEFLLRYLRARKFEVKKAFSLLQNYWRFRSKESDALDNGNPDKTKEMLLKNYVGPLPFRDRTGCVVYILRISKWNANVDTLPEMITTITATLIHSVQFPATQVCGYRIILDLRDISWQHVKLFTPHNMMLFLHSTQYCFPARYKAFHFLTSGRLFKVVWPLFYQTMTEKQKSRVYMHNSSNVSALREFIHPSVLPKEFGGDAGPIDMSMWSNLMDEAASDLLNLLNFGYKE